MDHVVELTQIVSEVVAGYQTPAFKATTHYLEDPKRQVYAVLAVPDQDYPVELDATVTVMARVVKDRVLIDVDITDRPLVEELVRAGIPREKIVLVYT